MAARDPEKRWGLILCLLPPGLGVLGLVLGNTIWDMPTLYAWCMIFGALVALGALAIRYFRQRGDDG